MKCKYCECLNQDVILSPKKFIEHLSNVHNKTIRQHTLFTNTPDKQSKMFEKSKNTEYTSKLTCDSDYVFFNTNEFIFKKKSSIIFECESNYYFDTEKYFGCIYPTIYAASNNLIVSKNVCYNMQKFQVCIWNHTDKNLLVEKYSIFFNLMLHKNINYKICNVKQESSSSEDEIYCRMKNL